MVSNKIVRGKTAKSRLEISEIVRRKKVRNVLQ